MDLLKKMFGRRQADTDQVAEALKRVKARMPIEIAEAHKYSSRHRSSILSSEVCGCFYCGETFRPSQIVDWTDDGQTAMCPRCGIDSVLGSASGLRISKEFLDEMNRYWF